jgi:hypothetical protein
MKGGLSNVAARRLVVAFSVLLAAVVAGAALAASAPPDPKTLVVKKGPNGYAVSASAPVTNDDVSAGGGDVSNRISGYRIEFTSPSGAVVRDTAAVYKTPEDAASSLDAEAASASDGLDSSQSPTPIGEETHFYSSPAGTPPAKTAYAIAWREGTVDAVVYGMGASEDDLLNLAEAQEYQIGAADTTPVSATGTTTTASSDSTSSGSSGGGFPWWILIVIVVAVGVGAFFFLRRRNAARAGGDAAEEGSADGATGDAAAASPAGGTQAGPGQPPPGGGPGTPAS